jgi:GNAT superfamily N-acetyltransferase
MNAKKTTVKIRRALLEDAAAIAALLYDAFKEYRPLYTEEGFTATTASQKEIEDRISKKAVWLAIYGNELCGTVSIFPRGEELFVRSMAVSPASRGKGIGKVLMEHVHEMAFSGGCSVITLNTTAFLLPAIRLYERFGFQRQGPGDLYGTPLIRMTKDLMPAIKNKLTIRI